MNAANDKPFPSGRTFYTSVPFLTLDPTASFRTSMPHGVGVGVGVAVRVGEGVTVGVEEGWAEAEEGAGVEGMESGTRGSQAGGEASNAAIFAEYA